MMPLKSYEGVVRGDLVVLNGRPALPEGTPVIVLPQIDLEDQWLTIPKAAQLFEVPLAQVEGWVRTGKVRGSLEDPGLVNAGDVEDAVEQDDLFSLAMECVAREEDD